MTKAEAAKLVAVLLASYPNTPQARVSSSGQTVQTSEVYERMLADLEYPTANAAVERLLATSRFMPTVAEIRDACMDLIHGDQRAGGEAWGECVKAISRWGIYRVPGVDFMFSDPLVARCVAALGWQNLCNSENQAADRARFIELYDRLAVGARRDTNTNQLPAAQRLRALQEGESANPLALQLAEKLGAKL